MNRFPACLFLLVLLAACSRSPQFAVNDQVLQWPALDSVTDLRIHLLHDGESYILASERSIFSISDTNSSNPPTLLYTFHDSLWEHYTELRHPGDSVFKPKDVGLEYFNGMPDFYIRCIQPIDETSLLVLLAFNSVSISPEGAGANLDRFIFIFDKTAKTVRYIDTKSYSIKKTGRDSLNCTLDDYYPIKTVKSEKGMLLYTASCCTYSDPNTLNHASDVFCYNIEAGKDTVFLTEQIEKTDKTGGELITQNLRVYSIEGGNIGLVKELDSITNKETYLRDACYFPGSQDMVLVRVHWTETENYTVQLFSLKGEKETIIQEIRNVTVPGKTIYPTNNGTLLYFYEKEALVHQLTLSAR